MDDKSLSLSTDEAAESSTRSTATAAHGAGDSRVNADRDMRGGVGAVSGTDSSGEGDDEEEADESEGGTTVTFGDEEEVAAPLRLIEGTRDMAGEERRDVAVEDERDDDNTGEEAAAAV